MTDGWWTVLVPSEDTQARARGRKFTMRGLTTAMSVGALVVGALTWALMPHGGDEITETTWGTSTRPTVAALAMGCGPLQVVTTPSADVGWVDVPFVLPYDTAVPAAGWFYPYAPARSQKEANPEQVVREMWEGGSVAWYASDAGDQVRARLQAISEAHPQWRMRVAQWPASRGEQLDGQVAFATWGATQTCDQVSEEIAAAVIAAGTGAPGEEGQEPPAVEDGAQIPEGWTPPNPNDAQPVTVPDDL